MAYLKPYKKLNLLIRNESFEPMISWGLRMALSGTLPIVWGLATGRIADATWIALTAEGVSWVELKGSFGWRVRTLLIAALLSVGFGILGTITGTSIMLSAVAMFLAAFLATLLKNIGDRASGLAICVYLMFIICNAYPVADQQQLQQRLMYIAIGAVWPVGLGIALSLLEPAEEPFRRQIALIWRAIADLITAVSKSGIDAAARGHAGDVYAREKEVREAIDSSFQFYGRMAHQVTQKDNKEYQLVQLRKTAGLAAVNVLAMGEEMAHIDVPELDDALRIKAATLFSAMKEAVSRISIFVITLKQEEKLMAVSHISRMKKLMTRIRTWPMPQGEKQTAAIARILQLTERTIRLLENALLRIDDMGKDRPVYRSYSFVKTLFVLNPRYFTGSLRVLFNFNSFTTRFALRSAIAATFALLIYKFFKIDHGYWMPFSVMIVIQPYFGATFKKAIDRVAGTVLGGVAGGLLLQLPTGLFLKEGVLFLTLALMVYYVRKNYAIAVFVVTLNLVLLFNLDASYSHMLMVTRALCTIGGAALAVVAGFALLPMWDKKWLPAHLAAAIKANYGYFTSTFYLQGHTIHWVRTKRQAESENSNMFDSFNRYMQEPGKEKSANYYDLITCNVRITRNLNNIHLEEEEKRTPSPEPATPAQLAKMNECLSLFNKLIGFVPSLDPELRVYAIPPQPLITPFLLNDAQYIALEKLIIELNAMLDETTILF